MKSWHRVTDQLDYMLTMEPDWDGNGSDRPEAELIESARLLMASLIECGTPPPDDVYPLPDDGLCIEWRQADVIDRIFVQDVGNGSRMITFPNLPPHHHDLWWGTPFPLPEN